MIRIASKACLTLYCSSPSQTVGASFGGSGAGPGTLIHSGWTLVPLPSAAVETGRCTTVHITSFMVERERMAVDDAQHIGAKS